MTDKSTHALVYLYEARVEAISEADDDDHIFLWRVYRNKEDAEKRHAEVLQRIGKENSLRGRYLKSHVKEIPAVFMDGEYYSVGRAYEVD